MSTSVLYAILGYDVVARLTPEDVRRLASEIDAALLADPEARSRLAEVVRDAAVRADVVPSA